MEVRYDQPIFSRGELDPTMQQRTEYEGYYKGLKYARNVLVIPQGGATSRWGTLYADTLTIVDATQPQYCDLSNYIFGSDTPYILVWEAQTLTIYLENIEVFRFSVAGGNPTPFMQEDIPNIRPYQQLDVVIIAWGRGQPYQLTVGFNAANIITGFTSSTLTVTTAMTVGKIYPVQFSTTGTLPVTNPQIYANVAYYAKVIGANSVELYGTAIDAKKGINKYVISSSGTGVNNLFTINNWTLTPITFDAIPGFDFLNNYNSVSFTPAAVSGTGVTVTLSAPLATLDSSYVGGWFRGNNGIMRITAVADTTHFSGNIVDDFDDTSTIPGTEAVLTQPAWSDARGWPALVSGYQNRLVFGRTRSIPNGRWLSVVNSFFNFDDSQTLDDDAISWYPTGSGNGFIQALTSARTLVVHTNTNTQSTPVLNEVPITPTNASFPEQSKFGALPIQPIYLDNQIIFVDKGNNAINMIWEITQSAFTTRNISLPSSGLIRLPTDMAAYAQPVVTDGFYALFVNSDGTLANFQSLIDEDVKAWTLMNTQGSQPTDLNSNSQPVTHNFVHVSTAMDRCWFLMQRYLPVAQSPISISGFNSTTNTLTAVGHGLPLDTVSQVTFATTGALPTTSPQITATNYYFAVPTDADHFRIFLTYSAASSAISGGILNPVSITSAGTLSTIIYWEYLPKIYLEELSFDVYTDCTFTYNFGSPSSVATGLSPLNGQVVQVKGDNYVLNSQTVFNAQIPLSIPVSSVQIGLQFVPKITPLPISIPGNMGVIYNPQHVRVMYVAYVDSAGMQLQGTTIPIINMQQFSVGEAITPQTGVWSFTPMEGWDTQTFEFDITQPYPLPMTITGLSYNLEVS